MFMFSKIPQDGSDVHDNISTSNMHTTCKIDYHSWTCSLDNRSAIKKYNLIISYH